MIGLSIKLISNNCIENFPMSHIVLSFYVPEILVKFWIADLHEWDSDRNACQNEEKFTLPICHGHHGQCLPFVESQN